jgi:hypothetical protein
VSAFVMETAHELPLMENGPWCGDEEARMITRGKVTKVGSSSKERHRKCSPESERFLMP